MQGVTISGLTNSADGRCPVTDNDDAESYGSGNVHAVILTKSFNVQLSNVTIDNLISSHGAALGLVTSGKEGWVGSSDLRNNTNITLNHVHVMANVQGGRRGQAAATVQDAASGLGFGGYSSDPGSDVVSKLGMGLKKGFGSIAVEEDAFPLGPLRAHFGTFLNQLTCYECMMDYSLCLLPLQILAVAKMEPTEGDDVHLPLHI